MKRLKQYLASLALVVRTAFTANTLYTDPPAPAEDSALVLPEIEEVHTEDSASNLYKLDKEIYTGNGALNLYEPDEGARVEDTMSVLHRPDEGQHAEERERIGYIPHEEEQKVDVAWEQIFTHELVMALMDKAERFACSVEMATFLAVMSTGGVSRLLADDQTWDAAARFAVHAVHEALIQHCEDDLERALKLYALWSEFGQTRGPIWAKDLFIRTDILAQEIRPKRETLLLERSVNKRDKHERRLLNFCLLDRVRLVIAYHLLAHPLPIALDQVVHMQQVWLDWLQQSEHSDIALAHFLARQTHDVIRSSTEQATSPEPETLVDELVTPVDAGVAAEESVPVEQEVVKQSEGDEEYEETGDYDDYDEDREDEAYWEDEVYEKDEASSGSGRLVIASSVPDLARLQQYEPGERVLGVVTGFIDAGIFIFIEPGVTGFVPKSRLWKRVDDLGEVVAINEEVEVVVVRINEERSNLELSMQLPEDDPFHDYEVGDTVTGHVVEVKDFGALLEIAPHVYGGIHISKMWEPIDDVRDVLNFGDTVRAYILSIDTQKRRLELSMQLQENDPLRAYRPGDVVSGRVKELRDFGAFVTIKPGVVGLIHRNDMRRGGIHDFKRALRVGDEIKEALVIRVEWDKRRLSLSTSEG